MLNSPILLLLATGGMIGATFPLGKLAVAAGVAPLLWSLVIAAGASTVLAVAMAIGRRPLPVDRHHLRYYAIAGVVSYALPNLLVYSVIPRLGSGFTAIFFALSPIVTLGFSLLARLRPPTALGIAGIGVGLAGALTIVLSKGQIDAPASAGWLALGLAIPVALAAGNVYRTLAWPGATGGLPLAVGTNLAAAIFLAGILLATTGAVPVVELAAAPGLVAAQVVVGAAIHSLLFRLQRVGGPVFLSQIGYVAAAVGLGVGHAVLGERYGLATWIGAAIVAAGVAMTTIAQTGARR